MAIAGVGVAGYAPVNNSGTVVVPVPSGVADGDTMFALVWGGSAAMAASGWTQLDHQTDNNSTLLMRVASSEPSSYTFSCSGTGYCEGIISAYSGVGKVGAVRYDLLTAGTAVTTPSIVMSGAGAYMVIEWCAVSSMSASGGSLTKDGEYYSGGLNQQAASFSKTVAAGATGTDTITAASSETARVWTVELLDDAGGGPVCRGESHAHPSTNSGTVTTAIPEAVQDGDIIIAVAEALYTTGGINTPSGWTALGGGTSGTQNYGVFAKIASSESGSYTFTSVSGVGYMGVSVTCYHPDTPYASVAAAIDDYQETVPTSASTSQNFPAVSVTAQPTTVVYGTAGDSGGNFPWVATPPTLGTNRSRMEDAYANGQTTLGDFPIAATGSQGPFPWTAANGGVFSVVNFTIVLVPSAGGGGGRPKPDHFWKLDEAGGATSFADQYGGVDLTDHAGGSTRYDTGLPGGIAHGTEFTTSDWAITTSPLTQVVADKFSMSYWVQYVSDGGASNALFCASNSGGHVPPYYEIAQFSDGGGRVVIDTSGSFSPHDSVFSLTTDLASSWHHYALVYDGTNFIVYVDGTAVATVADTGNVGDMGSFAINMISALNSSGYGCHQYAAMFGYWADYALTSTDVSTLYAAGSTDYFAEIDGGGGGGGGSPATITGLSPTSGPVGQSVVITGTFFTPATDVTFNGTSAASFTVDSATQITAVVDTGTTTGAVVVLSPDGDSTDDPTFTITVPPTITSLSLDHGPVGTFVIVEGTDFTGATDVHFNGTSAPHYEIVSDTQINVYVPSGTTTGAVTVTGPDGTSTDDPTFTLSTGIHHPDRGAGGVCISVAFTDGALVADPDWTDVTAAYPNLMAGYEFDRGRQFELDYTDTGSYTIKVYDRDGVLDPTNSTGPFYGQFDADLQVKVELWNPVAGYWSTRFRGWIEELDYDMDPSQGVQTLTITCYDILALLSTIEMQPGVFGEATPGTQYAGNIVFGDELFRDRIVGCLGDAYIPTDFYVVFSGNVRMTDGIYSPGDTPMNVIQDALDAEFPGVSNGYPDRFGRLAVHGRLAKFDISGVLATLRESPSDWVYRHWEVGDAAALAADTYPLTVQMRPPYSWNRGRGHIINSAMCYPATMATTTAGQGAIPGQLFQDLTSIGERGYASWSRENVMIDNGILTGKTGAEECLLFSHFFVANYAEPRDRITALTVLSIYPLDYEGRAGRVWDLLCNVDIADTVAVTVGHPGGGGFNEEPFFVEGVHEVCEPATKDYAFVTLSLDVSPQAYFDNPEGLTTPG